MNDRLSVIEEVNRKRIEALNDELKKSSSTDVVEFTSEGKSNEAVPSKETIKEPVLESRKEEPEEGRPAREDGDLEAREEREERGGDGGVEVSDLLDLGLLTKKVKIKVDGVEREETLKDVIASVQKNEAASERLRQAAELEKEYQRKLAEAEAKLQALNTPVAPQPEPQGPSLKDDLVEAFQSLYEGEQEKAAEKFEQVLAKRLEQRRDPPATVDTDALVKQVELKFAWDSALSSFSEQNDDIATDPYLSSIWRNQLEAKAPYSNTPQQCVTAATEEVRKWMASRGWHRPEDMTERKKRKAESSKVDLGSPTNVAPASSREEPQTYSDVIAEMREKRGQPKL